MMKSQSLPKGRKAFLFVICVAMAWMLFPAFHGTAQEAKENMLPNPSFEKGDLAENTPAEWATRIWGEAEEGTTRFSYTDQVARTGKRSVMIASEKGSDASWSVNVRAKPYGVYRLSGWVKTENVAKQGSGSGALLNVHGIDGAHTKALTGNQDWTLLEVEFETDGQIDLLVNCLYGGWGNATGRAWFDDVSLTLLRRKEREPAVAADWSPAMTINTHEKGEPVSPLIYGQFIEHLGRCIYGGIWAEMLEDRKFYDAPGTEDSPWKILGEPKRVKPAEESFVGEYTPLLRVAAQAERADENPLGLVQSGLGLEKGKRYEGYLIVNPSIAQDVQVSLIWGDGPADRATNVISKRPGYRKVPLTFTAGADTNDGRLEIIALGGAEASTLAIGTLSLMPADNIEGMRRDTLALLRELDSPIYRWPGGNFVSGYDWRDGIGDRDKRPPRKNPAWKGIEHNDFGIHEFLRFCEILDTEPYIAVNSGLGGLESAVDELEYVNGPVDSPMGKLRAKNGHPRPYGVKYWGIGNEMYGDWQLGHMPVEDYVKKHNRFAEAFREKDPSIVIIAVGNTGAWDEVIMPGCADHMDLISEHFYCREKGDIVEHVRQISENVRRKAEAHREYRKRFDELEGKDIDIALDEWNYWYGPHVYGELGTRYFLKDALGIAAGLNEMIRNSDIYAMANYAQTVNVIGAIKTSKTDAEFAATGLALKLYRDHFGSIPVKVEVPQPLDAVAAWRVERRGKSLTLAVVNPVARAVTIDLNLEGAKLRGSAHRWLLTGEDGMAFNEPGQPRRVGITASRMRGSFKKLTVAPLSVSLFEFPVSECKSTK